jgi:hypothetical protein
LNALFSVKLLGLTIKIDIPRIKMFADKRHFKQQGRRGRGHRWNNNNARYNHVSQSPYASSLSSSESSSFTRFDKVVDRGDRPGFQEVRRTNSPMLAKTPDSYQIMDALQWIEQHLKKKEDQRPFVCNEPSLKIRQPEVIDQLYSGRQCSSCGLRFSRQSSPTDHEPTLADHLDEHFRRNKLLKTTRLSRPWYGTTWLSTMSSLEEPVEPVEPPQPITMVLQSMAQTDNCHLCKETFKQEYIDTEDKRCTDQTPEGWYLINASNMSIDSNLIIHPSCSQ